MNNIVISILICRHFKTYLDIQKLEYDSTRAIDKDTKDPIAARKREDEKIQKLAEQQAVLEMKEAVRKSNRVVRSSNDADEYLVERKSKHSRSIPCNKKKRKSITSKDMTVSENYGTVNQSSAPVQGIAISNNYGTVSHGID